MAEKDVEAGKPTRIPHFRQVFDQAGITPEVQQWDYDGSGTEDDPYVVTWIHDDPRNPMLYSQTKKWSITMLVAFATLAVAFCSSAYSGGSDEIIKTFHIGTEVFTLGTSIFVLGFAIGPLLWAPLSELFGRQLLYITTYGALTAFNAGTAGAQNVQTLILLRFFAGAFGSSPLTNAGGVIADMFPAKQRGVALSLFAAAPFLGPVLGPIVGGFVGETIGWRWIEGVMAIFTGALWIAGAIMIPETYPPVLQRQRAKKLSKLTGKIYRSQGDVDQGPTTFSHVFTTSLSRPWVLLFREPIVLLLSIYMAIIYGTLYMLFSAFPIVYQEARGWSQGIGGLAFIGLAIGMAFAVIYNVVDNSKRYVKLSDKYNGFAPPEARLPPTMVGGIFVVIGLFWFAWTDYPNIQYMASIVAGIPFGFGMVLVFLGVMNYLIDAYTIFAASVLAANAVLRSLFGFAFPLFTTQMYQNLGLHWAGSVPGFLALICVPFPFLFWKYGAAIRTRCKYAAESAAFLKKMQDQTKEEDSSEEGTESEDHTEKESGVEAEDHAEKEKEHEEEVEEAEQEAIDYSYGPASDQPRLAPIRTQSKRQRPGLGATRHTSYEGNPFDLDRVATRESFRREARSRQPSINLSRTVSKVSRASKK